MIEHVRRTLGDARKHIAEWSCQEVASWVESFDASAPNFLEEEMDGEALTLATVEQLMALGLKRGPAIKMHARVEQLAGGDPERSFPTDAGTPVTSRSSTAAGGSTDADARSAAHALLSELASSSSAAASLAEAHLGYEIGDPAHADHQAAGGNPHRRSAAPPAPPCYLVYNVGDWLNQQSGPAVFSLPAPLGPPAGPAAPGVPDPLAGLASARPGGADDAVRPLLPSSALPSEPALAASFQARVAFHSEGTRGDVQPLLVLATALSQRGHTCRMFLDRGMCSLARKWGLEATEVRPSSIEEQMDSEIVKKAGSTGDFLAMAVAGKDFRDKAEVSEGEVIRAAKEKVSAFKPDLFVLTSAVDWVHDWTTAANVPLVNIWLHPCSLPSDSFPPVSLFRASLQPGQPKMDLWAIQMQFILRHALRKEQKWLQEHIAEETLEEGIANGHVQSAEDVFDQSFNIPELNQLFICSWSKVLFPAPPDWPETANLRIAGSFRLPASQEAALLQGPGGGFGDEEQRRRCEAFLDAGPAPVYIGWGSLVVESAEWMCRLAVGALREAGMRGVVVGGWARLSADLLDGDQELRAYCERAVLFLGAAPHAWLLPRCACAVHHGGMGTVQASVGAGVPTVVTPIWADQWHVADRVAELRLGARTQQTLARVTAGDLGEKIRKCCQDAEMRENARRASEAMEREDGVGLTVEWVEAFLTEARTGRWAQRTAARREALRARYGRRKRLGVNSALAMFQSELASRHPQLKAWADKEEASLMRCAGAIQGGRLFVVTSKSGLLVRESARLGSQELGRLGELSFVESLEQSGAAHGTSRCRVRLLEGQGPPEGWVSTTVSGKDVLRAVGSLREIGPARMARIGLSFEDLGGVPDSCISQ